MRRRIVLQSSAIQNKKKHLIAAFILLFLSLVLAKNYSWHSAYIKKLRGLRTHKRKDGLKPLTRKWIFYDGIPKRATIFLRVSMMKAKSVQHVGVAGEKTDLSDSTGSNYERGIVGSNGRFLLVTEPLRGGLHNQLMTLTGYGKLAAETNRTLILPQFLSNFPFEADVPAEYEDIFDVMVIKGKGMFLSPVVLLHEAPAGLFATRPPPTARLDIYSSSIEESVEKLRSDETLSSAELLVVETYLPLLKEKRLIPFYASFQMNQRLLLAFEECLAFILADSVNIEFDKALERIAFVHLRMEKDWLEHANKKKAEGLKFEDYYQNLPEIQNKIQSKLDMKKDGIAKTIFLSYAAGYLPDDTPDLHKGWPHGYRIVTSDDIQHITDKFNYLEKSVLSSQLGVKSGTYIGNSYSSYTRIITTARKKLGLGSRDFFYNIP